MSESNPLICTSKTAKQQNLASAIGSSFLGMFGLSSLFPSENSLQKLQSQVQEENQKTQAIINQGSEYFAKTQAVIDADIVQDFQLINLALTSHMDLNKTILDEKILLNTVYIAASFILILLLLIWNYIT